MKKILVYLSAILSLMLVLVGCGGELTDESIVSDSVAIVEDILSEEISDADEDSDIEDSTVDEDIEVIEEDTEEISNEDETSGNEISGDETSESVVTVVENGTYTSRDEVALYIYTYGKLPGNFITKNEAEDLGWISKEGNLDEVAPGMSIGGNRYGNYERLLPDGEYKECDINYQGGYRGDERLVYNEKGDIYYTDDHYGSFTQLYSSEDK